MSRSARVCLVTLGCGRNDVDSDQVAGALAAAGFALVDDAANADCVLVNTCTFIEPARQESVDEILAAAEQAPHVLVIGCMAQRYGDELAAALPEAAGVLSFGDYPRLPEIVASVLAGDGVPPPDAAPQAARGLPVLVAPAGPDGPPTAAFPVRTVPRGVWAYVKIAGGCDRACTFCTIPSYRGRFRSRSVDELAAEARWLAGQGVRELVCVSENTTSFGKDTPAGRRALLDLVRGFERIDGLERVRFAYLQPAELTDEVLDGLAASRMVAGYYDLSLQHASRSVLAGMARSGDADRFLALIEGIRRRDPDAAFRSSFITGFPGETDADVELLAAFLAEARLDWAGFFPYSPEDGTPAAAMPQQVPADEARARRDALLDVAEAVAEEQALGWVGRRLRVLVESVGDAGVAGRSHREAPETDGEVRVAGGSFAVGDVVTVDVTAADGVDLCGEPAA